MIHSILTVFFKINCPLADFLQQVFPGLDSLLCCGMNRQVLYHFPGKHKGLIVIMERGKIETLVQDHVNEVPDLFSNRIL
jgi:hypothetical protein